MTIEELVEALGPRLWGTNHSQSGKWTALPVYKGHEPQPTLHAALLQLYKTVKTEENK